MKKRILCFGDSNTWGYIPESQERYGEAVRWTGVLQNELGEGYRIIEEGLVGRTTVFADSIKPERCGMPYVLPMMLSQLPLDYIIVMLGTNDTKNRFQASSAEIGTGMEEVIIKIKHILYLHNSGAKIILISPVPINPVENSIFNEKSAQKSRELAALYKSIAERMDCIFFDAGSVVRELGIDGIHMSKENHGILGKAIAKLIEEQERAIR